MELTLTSHRLIPVAPAEPRGCFLVIPKVHAFHGLWFNAYWFQGASNKLVCEGPSLHLTNPSKFGRAVCDTLSL